MKVCLFDVHTFEKGPFESANSQKHEMNFLDVRLDSKTAILARSFECVCAFVNDKLSREVLTILKEGGTKLIALRSAGFNHIDLIAARELGLTVVRVPEYSPYSVAEHAVAMILCLNRKIHKAYNRVREGNFSLDGLVGFDLHKKKVGVIGTGKIGKVFTHIMNGFGCEILAYDLYPDKAFEKELGFRYVDLPELLETSDIISLHVPLSDKTLRMLNDDAFNKMKRGTMLINTSRGGLIDTKALIKALKDCHLGSAGLDVYEEEATLFFEDRSCEVLTDDVYARLMTFNNVLLTSHQAFLTQEALANIAATTLENINEYSSGQKLTNEVRAI
jgi:D-lactate dehydrogenase